MELKRNLCLEGETVLEYCADLREGPEECRRLARYLKETERVWTAYWAERVYPEACRAQTERRGAALSFRPWTARLTGKVTCEEERFYSMALEAEEVRGDGYPCLVRWGVRWDRHEDAPLPVENLFQEGRGWQNRVLEEIFRAGEERQRENLWFPDENWREQVKRSLKTRSPWVDGNKVFWSFPQGFMAAPADGAPVFKTEREDRAGTAGRNRDFP